MAAQHAADVAAIRQQVDKLVEAIRAMDLEGLKPIYAPDIVSFDVQRRCSALEQRENGKTGHTPSHYSSIRSVLRFATSRSPWAVTWHSRTASIGSAGR